jgi:cysteine-rich repeat protein
MNSRRFSLLRPSTSLLALMTLFGMGAGCNALLGNSGPAGDGLGGQGGEPFGGDSSVGGTSNSGGAPSGGRSSGGAGVGGKGSGGSSLGGSGAGGSSAGGASSGGGAAGGASSGGASSGGAASGGTGSGGASDCGNGELDAAEGCDDGGVVDGDGCSATCRSEATQLALGEKFTCALRPDRSVQCWGLNDQGQLGLGDTKDRGGTSAEMQAESLTVLLNQEVRFIAAGRAHACAIMWDRTVRCWGANYYGQLGLGNSSPRGGDPSGMGDALPPVDLGPGVQVKSLALGGDFSCALRTDLKVVCWGRSDSGQLGRGDGQGDPHGTVTDHMGVNLVPVLLGGSRTAKAIVAGEAHACAILDDETIKCWGDNEFGQLGQGHTNDEGLCSCLDGLPPIDVGPGRTVQDIAAGAFHTCALLDDGTVKCWGKNDFGQLGKFSDGNVGDEVGDMGDTLRPTDLAGQLALGIRAGASHTCAILDNGGVKCWGQNIFGQLGLNDVRNRGAAFNDADMGAALPLVDLGSPVSALATGATHNCVSYSDGAFRCWGSNYQGELGLGDTEPRGDDADEVGQSLPYVGLW